jgi:predicted transporter
VLGCDHVAWEKFVYFSEAFAIPNIRIRHKRQSVRLHNFTNKQTVFFIVTAVIISSVFVEVQVLSDAT